MIENRVGRVLPLLFKKIEVPGRAKEALRRQLFAREELTDEQLLFVAAAGSVSEQAVSQKKSNIGGNDHVTNGKI